MLQTILDQTVKADQAALDAAQGAYDAGTGDYISVVEARTTLQSAQTSAINVGLLRAQYQHAIAMLTGKVATGFSIPVRPLVYTPPPIPTGVPSQLFERRPDIAAAERTVAEANATIGIGYGAFFPSVTLGVQAAALKALPSPTSSTGPAASGPSDPASARPSSTAGSTAPNCTSTRPNTTPTWPPIARPASPPSSRWRTRSSPPATTRSRSSAAGSSQVRAAVPRPGDAALPDRRRSVCRRHHRPDHTAGCADIR